MNTNIGAGVRAKQIGKWKDAVAKNVDLLVAFPSTPIEDNFLAEFRGMVAERIKSLTDYLTTGTWGLFDGKPFQPPPSKEEREAKAKEDAERAEAKANAEAAAAVAKAASTSPLALPEPKCVHFDPEKNGCGRDDIDCEEMKNCDGLCRECSAFSIATPPKPAADDPEVIDDSDNICKFCLENGCCEKHGCQVDGCNNGTNTNCEDFAKEGGK